MSTLRLIARQDPFGNGDPNSGDDTSDITDDGWWWSPEAYALKWGIVAAIFVLFIAFIIGGYMHAQHRMKKGLQPLAYHRWLVTRRQRADYSTYNPNSDSYHRGQGYPMAAPPYAPPPAYNAEEHHFTPAYSPPEGATKVKPNQDYSAPEGPPPVHIHGGPSQRS